MEATFWDHVEELRKVFIRSLCVVGIGILISLFFYQQLFAILTSPLRQRGALHRQEIKLERINNPHDYAIPYELSPNERFAEATPIIPPKGSILIEKIQPASLMILGPIEGMLTTFKMAFWVGLVGTSPLWFYFFFSFVAPALAPEHKRIFIPFIIMSMLFISLGILFAFHLTIPMGNQYLQLFNEGIGTNFWTLGSYLDYTVILLLANGLAFEFGVILLFLVHYGVLQPETMASKRRHMIVVAFVLGALLTPPDVLTQVMMAIPLIALYELVIIYGKMRKKFATTSLKLSQKKITG